MIEEADWMEVNDHGESIIINTSKAKITIVRFRKRDWQIDVEHDTGAGTYGTVESKQDALNYVLDKLGFIEECDVSPKKVVIT